MDNGIGKNVKYYRIRANLTQTELATVMGYKSYSSISKIESGVRDLPLSSVYALAKALMCNPADFFNPIQDGDNFNEYVPYMAKASAETIANIRFMLHMPQKKIYNSEKEII